MQRLVITLRLAGAVALLLCATLIASAQQNPKRLVLKDGSFQTVTKWELQGNRVRYYSAERYTWEELPNEIIDWPATEKYNKDRDTQRQEEVTQVAKQDEAASDAESPAVAPGLRLPDGGGIFLLDTFQNQPQLIELTQNGSEVNKHAGRNILRAAINPLALSSRQTIEVKGQRATTQAHVAQPVIYASVDTGNASNANQNAADALQKAASGKSKAATSQTSAVPEHYGIVRMEKTKDARIVGNLNIAVYGKVSQKQNWVKTVSAPAGGDWVKITPAEPLTPGEYAVVEILDKGQINLYVWDFGVDPAAPVNANAWTARNPEPGEQGQTPALEKRPPLL